MSQALPSEIDGGTVPLPERLALLERVPVFAALPPDALDELAVLMQEERVPEGEAVVIEGEAGDRLFVILEGRAEASVKRPKGRMPLALMGPGELFGELALLTPEATRQATITALTPLTLLSLGRTAFDTLLYNHSRVRDLFTADAEVLVRRNFLKAASPFTTLSPERLADLAARLETLAVQSGEAVIRQGEPGERCYLLRRGRAVVLVADEGGERQIDNLGSGALFGEAALLTDAPRSATVRAVEPCELLVLRRDDLLAVMGANTEVGARMLELLRLRDRPQRAPDVTAHHRETATGEVITTLKDPKRGAYYRLSPRGWFVWQHLDGQHNLRALTLAYLREFKTFAPDAVAEIVGGLAAAGFVVGVEGRLVEGVRDPAQDLPWTQRMMARAKRVMEWYVPIKGVDAFLTKLYRGGVWVLFTRPAQVVMAALVVLGLLAFFLGSARVQEALTASRSSGALLLFLFPASFFAILLHEAGHAFTTKAFGREVNSMGVGLYWLAPIAYVDTSDMWLTGRWPRVAVNLAGVYTNAALAGIAAIVALVSPNLVVAAVMWQFALSSYIMVLLNLNPLLELDGYFVLMDLLERPNLRSRALTWLGNRLVPTLKKLDVQELKRRGLELSYGVASILYIAVEVWLSVILYRLMMQGWLSRFVPDTVAAGFTWVLAATVVVLSVAGILNDLRGARRRTQAA